MSLPVGADIESLCGKCGDVWHVVVAKVGDTIAKVQCKQCGGLHRHRPPGAADAADDDADDGVTAIGAAAVKPKKAAKPRTSRAKAAAAAAGPSVAADPSRPIRTYRASESYTPGDRVDHPSFGTGVVEVSPGPGKMQVFFPVGRKVLAQAKAASTLGRPPSRDPETPGGGGGPGVG